MEPGEAHKNKKLNKERKGDQAAARTRAQRDKRGGGSPVKSRQAPVEDFIESWWRSHKELTMQLWTMLGGDSDERKPVFDEQPRSSVMDLDQV